MKTLLFLTLSLLLTQCSTVSHDRVTREVFGGAANEQRIMTAPRVTASRLYKKSDARATKHYDLQGLKDRSAGPAIILTGDQARRLKKKLRSSKSYYFFQGVKPCAPEYGVLFTFEGKGEPAYLPVCFECGAFELYEGRQYVSTADFDGMHRDLVDLAKELFPSDPEIQKLEGYNEVGHLWPYTWWERLKPRFGPNPLLPPDS